MSLMKDKKVLIIGGGVLLLLCACCSIVGFLGGNNSSSQTVATTKSKVFPTQTYTVTTAIVPTKTPLIPTATSQPLTPFTIMYVDFVPGHWSRIGIQTKPGVTVNYTVRYDCNGALATDSDQPGGTKTAGDDGIVKYLWYQPDFCAGKVHVIVSGMFSGKSIKLEKDVQTETLDQATQNG